MGETDKNIGSRLHVSESRSRIQKRLLPFCESCRKVRDEKGHWQRLELYTGDCASVELSHGTCADCARDQHPEFAQFIGEARRKAAYGHLRA